MKKSREDLNQTYSGKSGIFIFIPVSFTEKKIDRYPCHNQRETNKGFARSRNYGIDKESGTEKNK